MHLLFFYFYAMMKKIFGSLLVMLTLFSCKEDDQTLPVVTLNGDSFVSIPLNGSYTEQGASATDIQDGALNVSISGTVNTGLEGQYAIRYTATDAAGNTGETIRVVSVLNQAGYMKGSWACTALSPGDTLNYNSQLSTSSTINFRIWVQGFAGYAQSVVYADISGDSIYIPKQPSLAGGDYHYMSGAGIISQTDTLKITIDYSDSLAGITTSGQARYVKSY